MPHLEWGIRRCMEQNQKAVSSPRDADWIFCQEKSNLTDVSVKRILILL